jgi:hypothetical protein
LYEVTVVVVVLPLVVVQVQVLALLQEAKDTAIKAAAINVIFFIFYFLID